MYDELIGQLRNCLKEVNCTGCDCNNLLIKQAADAIEELQGELQALKDDTDMAIVEDGKETRLCFVKKWIPVTERLPEAGKKVLVFAYGYDTITARMCKKTEDGYPVFECNGIYREMARAGRISHWMPLPQPPESDGKT